MAELRVGSVPLAATDASWKTHMSQVMAQRKLNHKPLNHKPQTTNHKPQTANHKPQTVGHQPIPNLAPCPLQVSHIGTWQDGSFGGDALDDNLIVDGWDRCARMRCLCLGFWSILLWLCMRLRFYYSFFLIASTCHPTPPPPPPLSRSASFDDKTWSNVYNHDAYMENRAVSADIMEPSHASSQVPATSVKKRLFDTVVEMSEVYARAPVGITLTLLHVCT
jgi:hypothetical protein